VAVEARLAAAVEDHMGEVVVRPAAHAGAAWARATQATSNDRTRQAAEAMLTEALAFENPADSVRTAGTD
jgi:hypothetical protein